MVGKKSVTTVLVLMCTVLIGVFSFSVISSVLNLRDKPEAINRPGSANFYSASMYYNDNAYILSVQGGSSSYGVQFSSTPQEDYAVGLRGLYDYMNENYGSYKSSWMHYFSSNDISNSAPSSNFLNGVYNCTLDSNDYAVYGTFYGIRTTEEFEIFSKLVSYGCNFAGKMVILEADLDFSGSTITPVGGVPSSYSTATGSFCGIFDGNYRTISRFNIKSSTSTQSKHLGLFGWVNGGLITRLRVYNATISGSAGSGYALSVGGMIGLAGGDAVLDIGDTVNAQGGGDTVIRECVVENVSLSNTGSATFFGAGGFVGCNYGSSLTVDDCMSIGVTYTGFSDHTASFGPAVLHVKRSSSMWSYFDYSCRNNADFIDFFKDYGANVITVSSSVIKNDSGDFLTVMEVESGNSSISSTMSALTWYTVGKDVLSIDSSLHDSYLDDGNFTYSSTYGKADEPWYFLYASGSLYLRGFMDWKVLRVKVEGYSNGTISVELNGSATWDTTSKAGYYSCYIGETVTPGDMSMNEKLYVGRDVFTATSDDPSMYTVSGWSCVANIEDGFLTYTFIADFVRTGRIAVTFDNCERSYMIPGESEYRYVGYPAYYEGYDEWSLSSMSVYGQYTFAMPEGTTITFVNGRDFEGAPDDEWCPVGFFFEMDETYYLVEYGEDATYMPITDIYMVDYVDSSNDYHISYPSNGSTLRVGDFDCNVGVVYTEMNTDPVAVDLFFGQAKYATAYGYTNGEMNTYEVEWNYDDDWDGIAEYYASSMYCRFERLVQEVSSDRSQVTYYVESVSTGERSPIITYIANSENIHTTESDDSWVFDYDYVTTEWRTPYFECSKAIFKLPNQAFVTRTVKTVTTSTVTKQNCTYCGSKAGTTPPQREESTLNVDGIDYIVAPYGNSTTVEVNITTEISYDSYICASVNANLSSVTYSFCKTIYRTISECCGTTEYEYIMTYVTYTINDDYTDQYCFPDTLDGSHYIDGEEIFSPIAVRLPEDMITLTFNEVPFVDYSVNSNYSPIKNMNDGGEGMPFWYNDIYDSELNQYVGTIKVLEKGFDRKNLDDMIQVGVSKTMLSANKITITSYIESEDTNFNNIVKNYLVYELQVDLTETSGCRLPIVRYLLPSEYNGDIDNGLGGQSVEISQNITITPQINVYTVEFVFNESEMTDDEGNVIVDTSITSDADWEWGNPDGQDIIFNAPNPWCYAKELNSYFYPDGVNTLEGDTGVTHYDGYSISITTAEDYSSISYTFQFGEVGYLQSYAYGYSTISHDAVSGYIVTYTLREQYVGKYALINNVQGVDDISSGTIGWMRDWADHNLVISPILKSSTKITFEKAITADNKIEEMYYVFSVTEGYNENDEIEVNETLMSSGDSDEFVTIDSDGYVSIEVGIRDLITIKTEREINTLWQYNNYYYIIEIDPYEGTEIYKYKIKYALFGEENIDSSIINMSSYEIASQYVNEEEKTFTEYIPNGKVSIKPIMTKKKYTVTE